MSIKRRDFLAGAAAVAASPISLAAAQGRPTVKLGHILPQSGVLKGPAEASATAADMAVAKINASGGVGGRMIELIRYDTSSDPRQAAVAARKLIEDDKVYAIVGPFSSGEVAVAMNDAERASVVMFPVAASRAGLLDGKQFLFRMVADESLQFSRVLSAMKAKGLKADTAEIMYISDEAVSNDSGTKTMPELLTKAGVKFGPPIAFQYKSFDVAPQVAKAIQSNPDVIALAGLPEPSSKVVHELRRQSFKGRVIGSNLWSDPNIKEIFGGDGDGSLFSSTFWKGSSPSAAAFDADLIVNLGKNGVKKLGAFHTDALTYDIIHLLADQMTKVGLKADDSDLAAKRIAIRDGVRSSSFSGILGNNICFDKTEGHTPGYVIEMRASEWGLFQAFPALSCA